ncbi:TIGR04282 family arsenosugar biosynthesis glycosyltransferase [Actinokineospora sp.]|uniref:TIGR04282 family arsenosugar biosynthesis glycosyltransferase n=1 Tax=Actinokineospora sp. TaxID=1872133 RepID=UPI003D6B4807
MTCVLVLAKAPVPGQAKTRLCPAATPHQAADLAAAALLDTLDAVLATPATIPVVALAGSLRDARRAWELAELLRRCTVIPQRGADFPDRLAAAHADTAARFPGRRVVQIGMDTPQITPKLLTEAATHLDNADAAIGLADDGGWWALGLRDPAHAEILRLIPTSRPDTGARTLRALRDNGLTVRDLPALSDVDTMADATRVAADIPGTRFAAALARVGAAV